MTAAAPLIERVARELRLAAANVRAAAELLDADATVPFIARYRKEATGSLDEVQIAAVRDRLRALRELEARREAIVKSLDERGLLTPELAAAVAGADSMTVLEDVYLPHRPKRRTRAMIARERGLAPLAEILLAQNPGDDPEKSAADFVSAEKGVGTAAAALAGARDIVAETVAEDPDTRGELRRLFWENGALAARVVEGKEEEGAKFRDWFAWSEAVAGAPSHRVLALSGGRRRECCASPGGRPKTPPSPNCANAG